MIGYLFQDNVAVLVGELGKHLFRCLIQSLCGGTAVAKEASTGVTCLKHVIQLLFHLATI